MSHQVDPEVRLNLALVLRDLGAAASRGCSWLWSRRSKSSRFAYLRPTAERLYEGWSRMPSAGMSGYVWRPLRPSMATQAATIELATKLRRLGVALPYKLSEASVETCKIAIWRSESERWSDIDTEPMDALQYEVMEILGDVISFMARDDLHGARQQWPVKRDVLLPT